MFTWRGTTGSTPRTASAYEKEKAEEKPQGKKKKKKRRRKKGKKKEAKPVNIPTRDL